MKILTILFLFIFSLSHAQESYNNTVNQIVSDVKSQIQNYGAKKVVFVSFQNQTGEVSELGQLLTDEIMIDCTIDLPSVIFLDKNDLEQYEKIDGLNNGQILNKEILGNIAMRTKADLVITGVMTPFGENIRIITKIYGKKDFNIVGGSKITMILDKNLKSLFDDTKDSDIDDSDSKDKAPEASSKNSDGDGEICFILDESVKFYIKGVKVDLYKGSSKVEENYINSVSVTKEEEQCFYELENGIYFYINYGLTGNPSGQIKITNNSVTKVLK